ncbi:periplasmic binding protein-like I [Catenaria anguillulae PL171]|uniref:Periplasmic binding protein-like I n=1 Tax=Catenaria anguillulae PL171 TaxID=765915 RepID=A0A1Y2HI15_9FUNG|nr:periplasmic binding protein-like I [Catenaria anguillulae PL171]
MVLFAPAFIILLVAHRALAVTFNLSVNLPFLTPSLGKSVVNIVKFIQANEIILNDIDPTGSHSFRLVYTATNFTSRNATLAIQNAIAEHNVVGVIGDRPSSLTIPQALTGAKDYVWMCSGASSSVDLTDKSLFPYFFRTMAADPYQGVFFSYFMRHIGWKSANVIASSDAYGRSVSTSFMSTAQTLGIQIAANTVFNAGQANFTDIINTVLNSGSQIIVLATTANNGIELLRQAKARGLISSEWVWLVCDSFAYWMTLNVTPQDIDNVNGMLVVYPREDSYNALYNQSVARFQQLNPGELVPAHSFNFLDCVSAMARGILRIVNATSAADVLARRYFPDLNRFFLHSFEGVTGNVEFDRQGNRLVPFQVFNFWNGTSTLVYNVLPDSSVIQVSPVRFFSGTSDIPPDRPRKNSLVATWDSAAGIALAVLNAVSMLTIVAVWAYLFYARERPTVKNLSFPFLTLIAIGCMLLLGSNLAALGVPTVATCQASLWLFCFGFELIFASSAAKSFRLFKIFHNKRLSKVRMSNMALMVRVSLVLLGQSVILAAWSAVDAQQPATIQTRSYITYRCSSANPTTDWVFSIITLLYNFALWAILIYFAYKTRNIASNFRETSFMFHTAQNTALTGVVVAAFAWFSFGESSLAAFIIKQCALIYSVAFAFAALIGRIAVAVYLDTAPPANDSVVLRKASNGSKRNRFMSASVAGTATIGGTPIATQLNQLKTLQLSVIRGDFAVKRLGSLMSTWTNHQVTLNLDEGVLHFFSLANDAKLGTVIRLSQAQVYPSSAMPGCLDVSTKSGGAWSIQFLTDDECNQWLALMAPSTPVGTSKERSRNRSTSATGKVGTGTTGSSGGGTQQQGV